MLLSHYLAQSKEICCHQPLLFLHFIYVQFLNVLSPYTDPCCVLKQTICYVGRIRGSPLSRYKVELDVQWTSDQPYFDFDTDMDAMALARSIAREPWSRKYFQGLRE